MSARYEEAVAALSDEQFLSKLAGTDTREDVVKGAERGAAHAVNRAKALALLACAEELEALVELLRERLPVPASPFVHYRVAPNAVDVVDGFACVTCGIRQTAHDEAVATGVVGAHPWNGGGSA